MMRLLLLTCFICLSFSAIGQTSKLQFGLLVKGGNFTLPNAKSELMIYRSPDNVKSEFRPGYQYTLGFYSEYRFSSQFSILAELSYRFAYFEYHEKYRYQYLDASMMRIGGSTQTQKSTSNTLVAPLKLQFTPKKLPKLHFQAGAGVCHNISVHTEDQTKYWQIGLPDNVHYNEYNAGEWNTSNLRMHFAGAILYQINSNTRLGIEYMFEKPYIQNADNYIPSSLLMTPSLLPLIDFIYLGLYPPSMHSFSVSLQHNLMH